MSGTLIHELFDLDNLAAGTNRGSATDMMLSIVVLCNEARCPDLSDRQMTGLWVPLRLAVPDLVQRAAGLDAEAARLLYLIRWHLDPEVPVPWSHIPEVEEPIFDNDLWYLAGRRVLISRLRRIWADSMARAVAA